MMRTVSPDFLQRARDAWHASACLLPNTQTLQASQALIRKYPDIFSATHSIESSFSTEL